MRCAAALSSCLALGLTFASPAFGDNLEQGVSNDLELDLVLQQGLNVPTGGAFLPDGRLLITEQYSGDVLLWDGNNPPATVGTVSVETGSERGLLGIAVDPQFATSNRIYFYYSQGGAQQVGYAIMDPQTDTIDTQNMEVLLTGMSASRNHDGGALAFGPDGYLYMGVGDTGCNCGCAPGTNDNNYFPTCLTNLHGKVLRIDRDGNIPATNPLVNETDVAECGNGSGCGAANDFPMTTAAPRTEIYNWGFRNPWRFAFDEQTGHLWIGDVGEVTWEEVTISTGPGQHHGWPFREGMEGQGVGQCAQVTPQSGDCKEPAFAYPQSEPPNTNNGSITGGVFSNHCSWPQAWHGLYWFADYVKGRVWTLTPNQARDGVDGARTLIVENAEGPVHFMRGPDGAIYYLNVNNGTLWRIRPANPAPCDMDGGVDPDAGAPDAAPGVDAGQADSGVAAPDAGATRDSGVPPADAGADQPDTGTSPPADAGGGGGDDDEADDDGCGCRAAPRPDAGSAWVGVALLLGGVLLRRRRG